MKQSNPKKEAIRLLNMFYADIVFLSIFASFAAIAPSLIYPWRLVFSGIGILGFIPFSIVPLNLYDRFKTQVIAWAKQKDPGMVSGKTVILLTTPYGKKLHKRNAATGLSIVLIAAGTLLFDSLIRSVMLVACLVLIPCSFFWNTDGYALYFHLTKEEEHSNEM